MYVIIIQGEDNVFGPYPSQEVAIADAKRITIRPWVVKEIIPAPE